MSNAKKEIDDLIKKIEMKKEQERKMKNTLIFKRRHERREQSTKFIDYLLLCHGLRRDDEIFLRDV